MSFIVNDGSMYLNNTADTAPKMRFYQDASGYMCIAQYMQAGEAITIGDILRTSTAEDDRVLRSQANEDMPIGIALESVSDDVFLWVAVMGVVQVQFKGGVTPVRGYVAYCSDTIAVADNAASAPAAATHFKEIGHVTKSASAGALAPVQIHFN